MKNVSFCTSTGWEWSIFPPRSLGERQRLAQPWLPASEKHPGDPDLTLLVGSGPFIFREYRPGEYVRMTGGATLILLGSEGRGESTVSGYWARRTGSALLVLGLVLVLNFVLFRMMPGDPVASIIDPNFSPDAKAQLSALYGLDKPLPVQFLLYVKSTLSFDFGISFLTGRPVIEELRSRVPNTIALLGTSLLLSSFLGTWLGMKAALKRGSLLEKCVLWSGALSFSFPSFFVQLVLLMAFAATLPLFPLRGTLSVPPPPDGFALALDYLWHMALPSSPRAPGFRGVGTLRPEPHGENTRRGLYPPCPRPGPSPEEHHPGARLPTLLPPLRSPFFSSPFREWYPVP